MQDVRLRFSQYVSSKFRAKISNKRVDIDSNVIGRFLGHPVQRTIQYEINPTIEDGTVGS